MIKYNLLNDIESWILDVVIDKLLYESERGYKANEIVDYMHEEKAYNETKSGEIIPFSLAKEIRAL